jgi:hypothetical protein
MMVRCATRENASVNPASANPTSSTAAREEPPVPTNDNDSDSD